MSYLYPRFEILARKPFELKFHLFNAYRDASHAPPAPKTTLLDTQAILAPKGEGCPRCGGAVYAAEQVLAKGSVSIIRKHSDRRTLIYCLLNRYIMFNNLISYSYLRCGIVSASSAATATRR